MLPCMTWWLVVW